MELIKEGNAFVYRNPAGEKLAEIHYTPLNEAVVSADHTYVADSLRGQGIAGQLLDQLVSHMRQEGKQIKATCSYVVHQFESNPQKYHDVIAKD